MAVELVNAAQAQAKKINNASAAYCENILKNSEEVLARSVADIKNTRMNCATWPAAALMAHRNRICKIGPLCGLCERDLHGSCPANNK